MAWNPRDIPVERPSSFDETGKRVFLYPSKVKGKFKNLRTIFYFFLLFIFLVIPWTTFDGQQTLFFDISHRKFVFFGTAFSAHDGPLIFFPLILAALTLGFVTSVWGRVWCGWACPQTVFLESVFRRIDQWVEGSHIQRMNLDRQPWSLNKVRIKFIKWGLFLIICSHIAHSFTAYFVGAKNLFWLTTSSPMENFSLFVFVQVFTLILLFNFGWFREQFCIIMCPYGRLQSVLMGKKSQAVLYDEKRGEPRRKTEDTPQGDCVNCFRCVSVCPMGIDIRRGLQMECIACTACMDACDEIMEKVDKPKGLIRYTSLDNLSSPKSSRLGWRSRIYLGILCLLTAIFVGILYQRNDVDINVLRAIEAPYTISGDTLINHFRAVIANQGQTDLSIEPLQTDIGAVISPELPATIRPGEIKRIHFFLKFEGADQTKLQGPIKVIFPISKDGKDSIVEKSLTILKP